MTPPKSILLRESRTAKLDGVEVKWVRGRDAPATAALRNLLLGCFSFHERHPIGAVDGYFELHGVAVRRQGLDRHSLLDLLPTVVRRAVEGPGITGDGALRGIVPPLLGELVSGVN